jgi:phosphoribosylaminoimidazolecarboxamide formyltransferase/IMP cyclohydrolase
VSPSDVRPVRRALISVADKTEVVEFAAALSARGVDLVATGSTAATLHRAGVAVTDVAAASGFPEILEGRVKTLHPAVHAAVLADRDNPAHRQQLAQHGIEPFDLVVANLYRFEEVTADPDIGEAEAIEHIDIGGPALLRAAAKNHFHVGVVVSSDQHATVLAHLDAHGGLDAALRRDLARRAFTATAAYDVAIHQWLHRGEALPETRFDYRWRARSLRYGENPHQGAAFYTDPRHAWGLAAATQHHGAELSYNNLVDADAAWRLVGDFAEPAVAIIKHSNPAGCAVAATVAQAHAKALAGDPTSAFGGVVAANRPIDEATATQIAEVFTEVVIAPGFHTGALSQLTAKKNLRVVEVAHAHPPQPQRAVRSVAGGVLVQDADTAIEHPHEWQAPTTAQPDAAVRAELGFAWTVCKHTKSNAIVLTRDRAVVGVGAGQMSRVDSVRLAIDKSDGRADGSVLASDAFFPFRDGPDVALAAGVTAIVQPGGSVRDEEVVAACDEHGVPMLCTGRRHFAH